MSKKHGSVVPVSGEDLAISLAALRDDLGLEGRVIIRLAPGSRTDLMITAEVYRDAGTRIGIARAFQDWNPGSTWGILTRVLMALHRGYHDAEAKATKGI